MEMSNRPLTAEEERIVALCERAVHRARVAVERAVVDSFLSAQAELNRRLAK